MLNLLAVHDADQVHNIYGADSEEEMLEILKDSRWWEDIKDRIEYKEEDDITLDDITYLYHDGDSEVGYTLNPDSSID